MRTVLNTQTTKHTVLLYIVYVEKKNQQDNLRLWPYECFQPSEIVEAKEEESLPFACDFSLT